METSPPSGSPRAVISLEAFRHNLECVRSYCRKGTGIMAVVKANAYGHGMITISAEAVRQGVDFLAVARVSEALEIRQGGIAHPLLVFEVPPVSLIDRAIAEGIALTVSTAAGGEAISRIASARGGKAVIHVKVDTGMSRLGFSAATAVGEIVPLLRLPGLELGGLYTHFATSEDADRTFADSQISRFNDVVSRLRREGIESPLVHMANSGAIISLPESHGNIVRPGIMLYGYPPSRSMNERHPVKPVMSLVSNISMIRRVPKGTGISYGRRFITPRDTVIATVPAGYADGYSRLLTGRASAIIHGKLYPVAGTICMDHIMVDIGEQPECGPGDEVTLIGSGGGISITAWDIAETLGTIPYEVTSLISARVPRVFTGSA